jgi:NADH-quinone oxidoreductase subunit D
VEQIIHKDFYLGRLEDPGQEWLAQELTINMGPQHPSTHGVLRLEIDTDGEIVQKVVPHLGYLHRNFEKHAENENYQQVVPYTDRLDYLAAMSMDYGWVLTVEKLMGLQISERVLKLRILFAELQRIASHMVAVCTFSNDAGSFTPFMWYFRDREMILDLFEMTCGGRLLYNFMWVGGLSHDIPEGFLEKTERFLDYLDTRWPEYDRLMTDNHIFIERTANVGILPAAVALEYGCTGPMLRGSGVSWDLRRDEPYGGYENFEFDVPVGSGAVGTVGDAWDRYWVRYEEMKQASRIIRQIIKDGIPEGDVRADVPRLVRPPKGEVYMRTEAPRGELSFYIVSDGSPTPYRVRCRSGSFCNLSVIPELARGAMIADLVLILGSIDIVLGEVDR